MLTAGLKIPPQEFRIHGIAIRTSDFQLSQKMVLASKKDLLKRSDLMRVFKEIFWKLWLLLKGFRLSISQKTRIEKQNKA